MKTITIILLLLCATGAFAGTADFASSGNASSAAPYLALPLHGQGAALSGAVAAWREDFAGVQYNPALLDATGLKSVSAAATYTIMSLDRRLMGAEGAVAIGEYLVAGLSLANHRIGGIEQRDDYGLQGESFDYQESSVAVQAAGRIIGNISIGGRLRYLYEHLYTEHANGIGVDLGAVYSPLPELTVGLSALNLGSYLWWSTDYRDQILPRAHFGVNVALLEKALIVEGDLSKDTRAPVDASLGVQYTILKLVPVRAGAASSFDHHTRFFRYPDFSLGLGLRYMGLGFDYACVIPSSGLGLRHHISLVGSFDAFK